MEQKFYVRIAEGLEDSGFLYPKEDFEKGLQDGFASENDQYSSVYLYNEEHYKQFQTTKSVRGIKNVVTDKIIFDFDSDSNPELARKDTLELVNRLKAKSVDPDNIDLYWSGKKGFTVTVRLDRTITPEVHEKIALDLFGKGLETLDRGVYNASRILRVPNTKHPKSNLYKVKLTYPQLQTLDVEKIKKLAVNPTDKIKLSKPVKFQEDVFIAPVVIKEKPKVTTNNKVNQLAPRHWKDYKWAILNAEGLKAGERHYAMMVIAATCRGLGYNQELTESFLKTFDVKYAENTKQGENQEEIELTLNSVFSENWNGGQYSIEKNAWLRGYCDRMGFSGKNEKLFIGTEDLHLSFSDFALNFEKNLVKTGIEELDRNATFMTSTHNGLLGKPGSGKTSMMLQWLANANKNDINSICYSLDMSRQTIYGKMLQNVSGCSFTEGVQRFKKDNRWLDEQRSKIKDKWGKVDFNFKSGVTVDMIRDDIKRQEDLTGNKVKLLMVDYLECLQSKFSDPTTGSGMISNELKDLANELELCSVLLLQTQKHSTADISDPLLSMSKIKGSSLIEQSMSTILTLWREGYNPKTVNDDRFMSFAVVKNRFGGLWTDDFLWNGKVGEISSMTDEGREHIKELRELKKKMRAEEAGEDPWK